MAGSLGIELTEDAKKLVEDHIEGGENGNKSTNPTVVTGANENKNENRKEVGSMAGPTGYIKNDYGTFEESTGIFTFNEDVKEIDKHKVNKIVKSLNESGVDKFGVTGNSVQKIGDMAFYGCSSLTTAEFNAATTIGSSAFRYCTALTTAEFNAVTTIGLGAFDSCSSLEKAEFKVAKTIGNYAFYNCSSLTKAEFPKAVSIGERAFEGCKTLNKVDIPNVTIDKRAFSGCPILEELNKKAGGDVPPPPEMSEEEKGNEVQRKDNVVSKANDNSAVPLTPLSTVGTDFSKLTDKVGKFEDQVKNFNTLVEKIKTFKSENKDKIKQVIENSDSGWDWYSKVDWEEDSISKFSKDIQNKGNEILNKDAKLGKEELRELLANFYNVMLNYLPYSNKEAYRGEYDFKTLDERLKINNDGIEDIKNKFNNLDKAVKGLSTEQDENKKNKTLASQTDGGMKPPNFPAPTPPQYKKMNELKNKFNQLHSKCTQLFNKLSINDSDGYIAVAANTIGNMQKNMSLDEFVSYAQAYILNAVAPLGDKTEKKYQDKCNQIYLNCRNATDDKTKSDCLTQMYELAARAVYRLEKNIAKQNKLDKAIYKAKKVGRKAGKKLDKFLGTDHVFHSKKNKDEVDASAKQAKLVKKCFKNAANYIVKFKLGSFKMKELNKAFNGLTGNEFISWKNELKQYFESTTQIDKFALAEDKKKDYKKASVAVVLASLCGLPNTECIISACEGLKEGGLRGNFKGRDYLNDAVKIRKDVKTKAIAGGKESVKSYLLSYNAIVKLKSLINYNTNFTEVVNEFSNIKYDEIDGQKATEVVTDSAQSTLAGGDSKPAEKKQGLTDKISGGVKTVGRAIGKAAVFAAGKAKDLFKKSPKDDAIEEQ